MAVNTPAGLIPVPPGYAARATQSPQVTFFAESPASTDVYDTWVQSLPLHYRSPNAHIASLRGGALRRSRMTAKQSQAWLAPQRLDSAPVGFTHRPLAPCFPSACPARAS